MSAIPSPRNTRASFRVAAISLGLVIVLSAAAAGTLASAGEWIDHTVLVQHTTDQWIAALLETEARARGFLLSGQEEYLDTREGTLKRVGEFSSLAKQLVVDNPKQLGRVETAGRHANDVIELQNELVALARTGHRDDAIARFSSGESRQKMDAVRDDIRVIRAQEGTLLADRRAQAKNRAATTLAGALLLAVFSCGLLATAWRFQRSREGLLTDLAREARRKLTTLSNMAVAFSGARTKDQVARAVVELGMHAARADTCTLYMLDESATSLELIGAHGVAPEVLAKIGTLSESSGNPATFETFKAGRTIWAESEADYDALFPALSTMKAKGPRAKAFWSVPLVAEGRAVGLLGMGFYQPRKFAEDERVFVETLTSHCAQALLRASLLEREDEARSWFTTTLRSIGDAVIATDAEGRITFMNPVAERLTGFSEPEARHLPLDEVFRIFSEQTGAVVESPVVKVLREGTVVGLANHTVLRSKGGVELPIDDSGAPIRNESGRLFGVVLVFRDTSNEKRERVRREFLVKASEALIASLEYEEVLGTVARLAVPQIADWCSVDVLPPGESVAKQAAVAHVDPNKLRFARELGERYPPDPKAKTGSPEVIRTGKSVLYPEIPAALLDAAARDGEHLRMIRELALKSAMVVPLTGRGRTIGAMSFIYAESGRRYSENDLAFAEDFARRAALAIENSMAIKEAKEARAHEQGLRNDAELANRSKDEFLAIVSHELRTPLTAILGWAVMLRARGTTPEVDRGLAVIERNARSQTKLIEDVLDVSRIISGKLTLTVGPTSVGDVVAMAVETVTPAADAKSIVIATETIGPPPTITADADRLQQVVWNLLSNAVKFTAKGGRVWVRSYREGSEVNISVGDSGEGISKEALPFVFELFRQADASTTRRHGGLGLGLAIVKQLVAAHGGTVRAESEGEGRGATFVVSLPARSAVLAVGTRARPVPAEATVATLAAAPRLDGLRILVIDDEEDALELVGSVLREYGAEVHCASSASQAAERLSAVHPDVIVSDIGMPLMDGYALMKKIRALPPEQGGRTPAIALTAYARAEDVARAVSAGYQMHVTKPVEPVQLATVVATLCGRGATSAAPS